MSYDVREVLEKYTKEQKGNWNNGMMIHINCYYWLF